MCRPRPFRHCFAARHSSGGRTPTSEPIAKGAVFEKVRAHPIRVCGSSVGYSRAPEKGGLYPSFSFDRIFKNHYGYSGEIATVYKDQVYNGFQEYRPIFYDVNGVYTYRLRKRMNADFMAGIGGERVLFYSPFGNCNFSAGCNTHLDSNHLLFHLGADIRYTVWRRFFVRPEAHLYRIVNNTTDFHSDNVLRVGASIGYTFGSK